MVKSLPRHYLVYKIANYKYIGQFGSMKNISRQADGSKNLALLHLKFNMTHKSNVLCY